MEECLGVPFSVLAQHLLWDTQMHSQETPLLNGPISKNRVQRSGILHIVTPRATQKCFQANLRVEFSGENHLLLICEKMPNQTVQLIKYLDSE